MAKPGITLGLSVMQKDGKLFTRKAHNAGNAHNSARQSCMKQQLSGKHFSDQKQQRAAFRAAAKACR